MFICIDPAGNENVLSTEWNYASGDPTKPCYQFFLASPEFAIDEANRKINVDPSRFTW